MYDDKPLTTKNVTVLLKGLERTIYTITCVVEQVGTRLKSGRGGK
jgi:hypothetical protein